MAKAIIAEWFCNAALITCWIESWNFQRKEHLEKFNSVQDNQQNLRIFHKIVHFLRSPNYTYTLLVWGVGWGTAGVWHPESPSAAARISSLVWTSLPGRRRAGTGYYLSHSLQKTGIFVSGSFEDKICMMICNFLKFLNT